jgi:hypothetical protein
MDPEIRSLLVRMGKALRGGHERVVEQIIASWPIDVGTFFLLASGVEDQFDTYVGSDSREIAVATIDTELENWGL